MDIKLTAHLLLVPMDSLEGREIMAERQKGLAVGAVH